MTIPLAFPRLPQEQYMMINLQSNLICPDNNAETPFSTIFRFPLITVRTHRQRALRRRGIDAHARRYRHILLPPRCGAVIG